MRTFGIDLGGTNVRCAVVDDAGHIVAEQRRSTLDGGWEPVVATCAELVRAVGAEQPEARSVGIGTAGMVDQDGVVRYAPNIRGLLHAPLRAALEDALAIPVVVDNDANAAAVAELAYGAARGVQHALMITLGTGIGGAIIANGSVYRGAHRFAAEVGHFQIDPRGPRCACGEVGHWEALASGPALGRMGSERARAGGAPGLLERSGGDPAAVTGVHVGDAALAGDADALALVREYTDFVAIGLAGLINILDPERIVVSGGLVALGDVLFDPLQAAFARRIEGARYRPPVAIVPAALGERAGVIGAAVLARGRER